MLKKILVCFLFIALVGSVMPAHAFGKISQVPKKGHVILGPDEVIDHDYFVTGELVEIYGKVNGDVYAAGEKVLIDGIVNGDVLVAGGRVEILGNVAQDIRVAGATVKIAGDIGRNMTIFAGDVEVLDIADVKGSALIAAGDVTLSGPIGGDVKVGAGDLTVGSEINGNLEAGVGDLDITEHANIGENVSYWSEEEASIDPNARIAGKVVRNTTAKNEQYSPRNMNHAVEKMFSYVNVLNFFSVLIIGLLLLKFIPRYAHAVIDVLKKKPMASAGVGLLYLFGTPVVIFILFLTVVGIPLGFILLALYIISLYLAKLFVSVRFGQWILEKMNQKSSNVVALILGLVVYSLLIRIPVIGGLLIFLTLILGLGAMGIVKKQYLKKI